jgi:hypothetical protein
MDYIYIYIKHVSYRLMQNSVFLWDFGSAKKNNATFCIVRLENSIILLELKKEKTYVLK